jgi:hypothetical protein
LIAATRFAKFSGPDRATETTNANPAERRLRSTLLASSRLNSCSARPLALIAPGDILVCPTSMTTRKAAGVHCATTCDGATQLIKQARTAHAPTNRMVDPSLSSPSVRVKGLPSSQAAIRPDVLVPRHRIMTLWRAGRGWRLVWDKRGSFCRVPARSWNIHFTRAPECARRQGSLRPRARAGVPRSPAPCAARHRHLAPRPVHVHDHEQVHRAVAAVFVIDALDLAGRAGGAAPCQHRYAHG